MPDAVEVRSGSFPCRFKIISRGWFREGWDISDGNGELVGGFDRRSKGWVTTVEWIEISGLHGVPLIEVRPSPEPTFSLMISDPQFLKVFAGGQEIGRVMIGEMSTSFTAESVLHSCHAVHVAGSARPVIEIREDSGRAIGQFVGMNMFHMRFEIRLAEPEMLPQAVVLCAASYLGNRTSCSAV